MSFWLGFRLARTNSCLQSLQFREKRQQRARTLFFLEIFVDAVVDAVVSVELFFNQPICASSFSLPCPLNSRPLFKRH